MLLMSFANEKLSTFLFFHFTELKLSKKLFNFIFFFLIEKQTPKTFFMQCSEKFKIQFKIVLVAEYAI